MSDGQNSGSLPGDDKVMPNVDSEDGQSGEAISNTEIKAVILKAISEPDFKQLLLTEPDKAFEQFELTEVQKTLLRTLNADDLDKLTPENLDEYFSADAAVYTPDEGANMEEFDTADEDEIL